MKRTRHDGWKGVHAREQNIKQAIYNVLREHEAVNRIFGIIKQQTEY